MNVLVVNSGSSSLKYQLIDTDTEAVLAKGLVERIGDPAGGGRLKQKVDGKKDLVLKRAVKDHSHAAELAFEALMHPEFGAIHKLEEIDCVGHRVLHGGEKLRETVAIDEHVISVIDEMSALGPLHNPANLMGIRACIERMPDTLQVAVFDTAFHSTMPKRAYMYAIPYNLYKEFGLRRYGFHGTSHKYVTIRSGKMLKAMGYTGDTRVITCHLGNGCSASAVVNGRCVDTSMGVTPAEGLVMGTRCGDIDPAILPFLMVKYGWSAEQLEELINKKGGLLALSGASNDMRDVEERAEKGDERAQLAVEVFCYRVRKYIGAYAAAMGGLDAIVFTGGIGENSPTVRARCCEGLEFLGVQLDPELNTTGKGEREIGVAGSKVRLLVIPTNEELMIARETAEIAQARQVAASGAEPVAIA